MGSIRGSCSASAASLARYDTVEVADIEVTDVQRDGDRFAVSLSDGSRLSTRKVLLTTGVVDFMPDVPGIYEFYGRSIFHCPYCDGWEVRDRPLAVYGRGTNGPGLAEELTGWSSDLTLVTDGPAKLGAEDRAQLARQRIGIREQGIARLEGNDGILERIVFADGNTLECRAMFFNLGHRQHSDLAARLGVSIDPHGDVIGWLRTRQDFAQSTSCPTEAHLGDQQPPPGDQYPRVVCGR